MINNLTDFLFDTAMAFLFIAAVVIYLMMNSSIHANIQRVKHNMTDDKGLYQSKDNPSFVVVGGSEIINTIHTGLETDIIINSYPISKSIDKHTFNFATIDFKAKYKVTYNIDTEGRVQTIVYTKQ